MLFTPVLGLVLASFTPVVYSQLPLEQAQQTLIGTWSSGSKHVLTGPGFANPANQSFNYPPTTGISYSFTDTFYELSRYRFNSNGSDPTCITGVIGWSHGKYQLNTNGSMTLFPFPDGYQQIQDPCAAVSNFIEDYRITEELYVQWAIFVDPTFGPKLHLNQFDGAPLAPMFQVSSQPNMLPTQPLRNVSDPNADSESNVQRRGLSKSGALSSRRVDNVMTMGVSGLIVAAFASLAL
ncbi:hypothetical protein AGABI1DRAFT_113834 [Agaricus bisporus var. burnettii JB137-S8]|uniref:Protein ROT1 n=1 Tax=Agaricus bisporus var. burnettii (strain JB137-S8 / ATCC MYA-4627 / FGSC 10392) TaxID=597362 RepID=K5WUW7_AGABU|nr:uncharacterized protein AGABI1DRAFT_113834 [Agaricus bisporus var. burnettii JB137-S8]EKM79251.1 hypothetical protein AGABI1DRAFT_113834 [Agaricus bisporus var. burnettii JB137-S8]